MDGAGHDPRSLQDGVGYAFGALLSVDILTHFGTHSADSEPHAWFSEPQSSDQIGSQIQYGGSQILIIKMCA